MASTRKVGSTTRRQNGGRFLVTICQIIACPPRHFVQPCVVWTRSAWENNECITRTPTEDETRRDHFDQGGCVQPTHDDVSRHCLPDVFSTLEQCVGEISGRVPHNPRPSSARSARSRHRRGQSPLALGPLHTPDILILYVVFNAMSFGFAVVDSPSTSAVGLGAHEGYHFCYMYAWEM